MWKRYLALGITAVMLMVNVPVRVYASETADETMEQTTEAASAQTQDCNTVSGNDEAPEDSAVQQEDGSASVEQDAGWRQQEEQALTMLTSTLAVQGESGTYVPYQGAKYSLEYTVGADGITITGASYLPEDSSDLGQLVIPEKIDGVTVTTIGARTFEGCSGFTSELIIPASVTTIGYSAFRDCSGFTGNLVIPASVTIIGDYAFGGCSGFTGDLIVPCGATSIGAGAFDGCSGFTGNLIISEGVTTIGSKAFHNCSGFTGDLIIPDSVTTIGEWTFDSCSGFTGNLIISEGVTTIGDYAFGGCSGFTGDLVIPDSVTSIGEGTFFGCNFTDIVEWGSISEIPETAFFGCDGLTVVHIPGTITKVCRAAFKDCANLRDVLIDDGVQEMGSEVFGNSYMPIKQKIVFDGDDTKISDDMGGDIICGNIGSTAQSYAESQNKVFFPLNGTVEKEITEYNVSSTEEFLAAIGSYRKIILSDGTYEITEGLKIENIKSLTIEAQNPGKAEILSGDRYSPVIEIDRSSDIEINGCIIAYSVSRYGGSSGRSYVVFLENAIDVRLISCDLHRGLQGGIQCGESRMLILNSCVIRDCRYQIARSIGTLELEFLNCVISGSGSEWDDYTALIGSGIRMRECTFLNNNHTTLCLEDAVTLTDCIFSDNAWDGKTPGAYGICLNGITWQVDNNILKIGYPLTLEEGGSIKSATGTVLPYSECSLPWKDYLDLEIDVAEGVEYDDGKIVDIIVEEVDVKVDVSMTKDEQSKLLAALVNEEEQAAIEAGSSATLQLAIANAENTLQETEKQMLEELLTANNYSTGLYLDITMSLQIGENSKRRITQIDTPIEIVLDVPEELRQDNRVYSVIRMHDGVADVLLDADMNPDTVTIRTDRFSSYTLVYKDAQGAFAVSGMVISFGDEAALTTLELKDSSGEVISATTVAGSSAAYSLENIPSGTYTLRVSKENHVTREYTLTVEEEAVTQDVELHLPGDINGDGKINARDKKMLYNHISELAVLEDYDLAVADLNGDGKINARDKKMLYNHIAGLSLLW